MKVKLLLFTGLLSIILFATSGCSTTQGNTDQVAQKQATVTTQATSTQIARTNTLATATAALATGHNPYPPYSEMLLLNTSLSKNTSHPSWDEGADPGYGFCTFTGGAYHVEVIQSGQFYYCTDSSDVFTNFAYQVQTSILKGDQAGLSFRSGAGGSLYYLYIDVYGNYELNVNKNHNFIRTISSGSSTAIKKGFNQSNLIAVVAQGKNFDLYVNLQHLAHASDITFNSGKIGVITGSQHGSTEAAFSNAKVWKL